MKLATLRLGGTTTAARIEGDEAVALAAADVGALLRQDQWQTAASADGARHRLSDVDLAPVVPDPGKIVCVGLNYRNHILEMGRELPDYPTLFAKFSEALIGPNDQIELPKVSEALDWEAELAVVVGSRVRGADRAAAEAAIAGYAVLNDVTVRDYQYRTKQWLQGKTFEATTPFGPYLVTPDEFALDAEIVTEVDGEVMQRSNVSDLLFDPVHLVSYISEIVTLNPGDVIATGTPGGVGHARKPPRYLAAGSKLVTRIDGLGELVNTVREPS
ncbi:fumarylacetoacetate hydrolase family protein [Saccharopolyspora sp. K220]|uniref:fumarylacetoacetate hydrolase family protein n=1 Tax=Saccharopolyspora soli TaxID=2926618 RepID=UPI001F566E37|nr:fumarylacetoacetate hydrolase family protein [Saccharopolyspora soli]MCI2418045.1 fumarylacetoacetate hydrolase family protein [Saccharopolyspora soli]